MLHSVVLLLFCIASVRPAAIYTDCRADILFVLDVSGTISRPQFEEFKDMLRGVAHNIRIDGGQNRVALVRFFGFGSRNMWTIRDFDSYEVE